MAWTAPATWGASNVLTAAQLNTQLRDNLLAGFPDAVTSASWTPIIVGSTGNSPAAVQGREYRIGPLQFAWAFWDDFIGDAGGGDMGVLELPLPATSSGVTAAAAGGQVIGTWRWHDSSSTADSESGAVYLSAGATARFGRPVGNVVNTNQPIVSPATGDRFSMFVCYPVA
jgi:hypothetical protein